MNYKIGLIQANFPAEMLRENLQKAECMIRNAASQGANIVCLPESFNQGYDGNKLEKLILSAEATNGETLTKMCSLANELNIYLIAPIFVRYADGTCKNSAFLISDTGVILGSYAKTHPIDTEKGKYTLGDTFPVFETKYGKIGFLICNDLRFMETGRLLGIQGVDIVFIPSAWRLLDDSNYEWELMLRSHAINNHVLVAATNRVGDANEYQFAGETMIIGPDGGVLNKCNSSDEQILIQSYSQEAIWDAKIRSEDIFTDRRPDVYTHLTQQVSITENNHIF